MPSTTPTHKKYTLRVRLRIKKKAKEKGDTRPEIDEMLKRGQGVFTTRSIAISESKTEPGQRARQS